MNEQMTCQPDKGWNFNNCAENERAILKPLCQRIEKLFELSARRPYRYFASVGDGWDDYFVRESRSCYYRGMHIPFFRIRMPASWSARVLLPPPKRP
jgi:hypothetical protein